MRFSLLGSGSRGNALLVTSPGAKVLIDSGFSWKRVQARAAQIGESLSDLKAVFVTHEHSDHVSGVGVLARQLDVPVYMTAGTAAQLPKTVGAIPRIVHFEAGEAVAVDGLTVRSYSVSHDAADPVSFVVEWEGLRLGIATDLGHAPNLVKTRLAGAQALVLESNHCTEMLRCGPYPPALQQRIRSRQGHLSNVEMNALLESLMHDRLRLVVLAHLSQENNSGRLAHELAARVLENHGARLVVAEQDAPTRMFEVEA